MGHLGRIHFQVCPEERSIPGQTRSNKVRFSNLKLYYKTCLCRPVLSRDSKNVVCFYVRQSEMPKIAFQKVMSSHLLVDCAAKNKDIALKIGMCVVCL